MAPVWTPNLEPTPSRLTATDLAILANSQDPYSIGTNGNVVCTINGTPLKDDGIAGYYALRHGVPCANISVISMPVVQSAPQSTFTNTILPAVQALSPSLQAIALAWVEPSIVAYNTGNFKPESISAAIAYGGLVTGTYCFDGGTALISQGPNNPYFNTTSQAPFTDYKIRPTMMLVGETCAQCTAVNNFNFPWAADFPTAKSVIDAAIAARDTNPAGGNIDWAITSDTTRSATALAVSPLELGAGITPLANAQILGRFGSPYPTTVSDKNLLLYINGAPHWLYSSPSFLPGAGIGFSVTSTSGWLPSDGNQTTAASWLSQGAVGAYGNAVEGCGLFLEKNPDPLVLMRDYTQGQTLVEALWKSVRQPWDANFLGDPLASPYSLAGGTAPVLQSISPASAAANGAVSVTLTGSNFSAPATVAVQGTGVTVSNTAVVNASTITTTFTIATGAAAGAYNVTVNTAAGTSGTAVFQVSAAAPVLNAVSPNTATAGTATNVTLTGTNLTAGSTVNVSGSGVTVSGVTFVSAAQITAAFTVAANATPGAYSVSVTNSSGTSNAVGFTVTASPTPTLSSLSPNSAAAGTATNVTLTGTNFTPGSTVNVSGSGVTVSGVTFVSAAQITAAFTVAANATPGAYSVTVTNSSGTSNAVGFTVTASPTPTLSSLSPNSAAAGTATNVTLTGTNFTAGSTITVAGVGVTVNNVAFVNASQLNATFSVAANATQGAHAVTVANSAGTSASLGFTVNSATPKPVLSSLSPASGTVGTNMDVNLNGSNFTAGATVSFSGIGVTVSNVSVPSATQVKATLTIAPGTTTGIYYATVVTSAGASNAVAFQVTPTGSAPVLTQISPASGPAGTSVNVTLTGSNFVPGTVIRLSGIGASVRNTVVVNPTQITATFLLDIIAAPGAHDVYLTNANGNSSIVSFTVN